MSDYATAHNSDEDFAETISHYVYQPDWVRTVAPNKYTFVKEVVDGYEYVVLVDEQFTFQVFNIEPDYTFPGKIVGVDIEVLKLASGDNQISATLHLSANYGDGAERAYSRIFSPSDTYIDVYFYPVNSDKHLLRAIFTINQYMASGYWTAGQITVHGKVDNRRYEGQDQFGWLLFIDNPNEDIEAPLADIDGISGDLALVDGEQTVTVYIPVTDENEASGLGGYATLQQYDSN